MTRRPDDVPVIKRAVSVSWTPDEAFRRFTADISSWWPRYAHSVGGRHVKRVVLECRVGGRLYEEHHDGTRYLWGAVTAFDAPRRLAFTFHAAFAESDAQQVEITFTPAPTGTLVELVSSGWDAMGAAARRSFGGYRIGWRAILQQYARQFGAGELLFVAMAWAMDVSGGRATFMRNSLGRVPPPGA